MTDPKSFLGQSGAHSPPLVAVHDTWISVDPVLGCVANCEYCYLGPMELRAVRPKSRATIEECLLALEALPAFSATDMPVCVGNYTDMLMRPVDRPLMLEFVYEFARRHPTRTLCVVTKGAVDEELADDLDRAAARLVLFLSQSFACESPHASLEKGPTATFEETLASMRNIQSRVNLTGIHFWRPFISHLNPLGDIPRRLKALKEAGSSASVIVGFKLASERKNVSASMTSLTDSIADGLTVSGDEVFFSEGFARAVQQGRSLSYPVLRNTSCGLAGQASVPEALGTRWGPLAESRCTAVACPEAQRKLCDTNDPRWPELERVERLAANLCLDTDIGVEHTGHVRVGSISEGDLNALTNALRLTVTAGTVRPVKVWAGATMELNGGQDGHDVLAIEPGPELGLNAATITSIQRLRGITGFVTTLQPEPRETTSIFSRYEHVQRVVWLTRLLTEGRPEIAVAALRYAWIHDANRWAFAHNAEQGRFDQAANTAIFFASHADVGDDECQQLTAFHARDISSLSEAALVACAADMIAGTIEDPILLTAGLNVSPAILADPSRASLVDFHGSDMRNRLANLAESLHVLQAPEIFRRELAGLFCELTHEVVRSLRLSEDLREAAAPLFEQIQRYKQRVLQPVIFPINNDVVCHSNNIRRLVVDRLFERLPDRAEELLLVLDEHDLVAELLADGVLEQEEAASLIPELTNVARRAGVPALLGGA